LGTSAVDRFSADSRGEECTCFKKIFNPGSSGLVACYLCGKSFNPSYKSLIAALSCQSLLIEDTIARFLLLPDYFCAHFPLASSKDFPAKPPNYRFCHIACIPPLICNRQLIAKMSFSSLVQDLALRDSPAPRRPRGDVSVSSIDDRVSHISRGMSYASTTATSVSISGDISSQLHGGYHHPLARSWQAERQLTKVRLRGSTNFVHDG
jgi:hypothetical protein